MIQLIILLIVAADDHVNFHIDSLSTARITSGLSSSHHRRWPAYASLNFIIIVDHVVWPTLVDILVNGQLPRWTYC